MEALNNQTNLDDLNLNIDSFQGGLECNVDEVSLLTSIYHISKTHFFRISKDKKKQFFSQQLIQQELNIDGLLDINIPISTHYTGSHLNQTQNTTIGLPLPQNSDATKFNSVQPTTQSAGVTSPSWVH